MLAVERKPDLILGPMIENKEVLKEAQTQLSSHLQHIKDSACVETNAQQFSISSSKDEIKNVQEKKKARDNKKPRSEGSCAKFDDLRVYASIHGGTRKVARIPLRACSSGRQRDLSTMHEAKNTDFRHFKRPESARNVLRLFRLRQENDDHRLYKSGGSVTAKENEVSIANSCATTDSTGALKMAESNIQNPTQSLNTQKRANMQSHYQRSTQRYLAKERVYPLRLDYETDNARLKLLGKNATQRCVYVKRKEFVFQECQQPSIAHAPNFEALGPGLNSTDVLKLKNTSTQTTRLVKSGCSSVCAESEIYELVDKQQDDCDPRRKSLVEQDCEGAHFDVTDNVRLLRNGMGSQCQLNKCGPDCSERKNEWPQLLSIADKFPMWVDLNDEDCGSVKSYSKKRIKYLQVARFDKAAVTTKDVRVNDVVLTNVRPSEPTIFVSQRKDLTNGKGETQSTNQKAPDSSTDLNDVEQRNVALKTRYRIKYQKHFSAIEDLSRKHIDDRREVSGINTLIDLRENMKEMHQRLQTLENCANAIDNDFKISQKVRLKKKFFKCSPLFFYTCDDSNLI